MWTGLRSVWEGQTSFPEPLEYNALLTCEYKNTRHVQKWALLLLVSWAEGDLHMDSFESLLLVCYFSTQWDVMGFSQ